MLRRQLLSITAAALCLLANGGMARAQVPSGPAQTQPTNPGPPGSQVPGTPPTLPETTPTRSKVDDRKFLKNAALGGVTEVELGKLAAQKASNDTVRQFGQKIVDDHTKANDALKQVAAKQNVDVPDSLDSKHQSRINKLSKLSGVEFDKAYIKDQLKDHEQDVREFKNEAQNGSEPDIQQFASQTLPVLQQHLRTLRNLNKTTSNESR